MLALLLSMLEDEADQQRFAALYEQYYDKLAAVAAAYFRDDPNSAEDAVQNTFIKVINHFEKVSEILGNELLFWLVSIVKNESISLLRKRSRTVPFEDWVSWEEDAEETDNLEYRQILDLIRQMPETYRTVLELRFVEELEYWEIAKALRLREGTVKSRISRGRTLLVKKLREEEIVP